MQGYTLKIQRLNGKNKKITIPEQHIKICLLTMFDDPWTFGGGFSNVYDLCMLFKASDINDYERMLGLGAFSKLNTPVNSGPAGGDVRLFNPANLTNMAFDIDKTWLQPPNKYMTWSGMVDEDDRTDDRDTAVDSNDFHYWLNETTSVIFTHVVYIVPTKI